MLFKPSCDSDDVSTSDEQLPELQVNDLIILYYYIGAYTTSAGTKFIGFYSRTSTHLLVPSTLHIQHKIEAEEHDLSLISVQ